MVMLLVAGFFIFFGSAQALAQPEDVDLDEPAAMADSKAARELTWVIDVVNGRDLGDPAEKFSKHFLDMVPPADLKKILSSIRDQAFDGSDAGPRLPLLEGQTDPAS